VQIEKAVLRRKLAENENLVCVHRTA
jgi:hypothetical protein